MNFPNQISGTFTKNITLGIGSLRVYKGSSLFLTFTSSDILVTGNSFTIDVTNMFPDNDTYFILIDDGLFKSGAETYTGITNPTQWTFTIADGEYTNTEYSNEYLLN
jgi:hypothetical protein